MSGLDADPSGFPAQERRRRGRIAGVLAVLVLGPVGLVGAREVQLAMAKRDAKLTAAQSAELSQLLAQREAAAEQSVARWNQASAPEALAALVPAQAECPLALQPPSQFSAGAYVKFATHDEHFGAWSLCLLRPGAPRATCERKYQAPAELTQLRERLAAGDVYAWDLDDAKAAPPPTDPPHAVVVVDEEAPGKIESALVGKLSFIPGTLSGHAFLYAPEQGRFICAGTVSVANSKAVEIEYSHFGDDPSQLQAQAEAEGHAALERDLEVHLRFALPHALRRLAER